MKKPFKGRKQGPDKPKPKSPKKGAGKRPSHGPYAKEYRTDLRLNKYLAHAGIASRRKADELIKAGNVTVNGKKVLEPGKAVTYQDLVKFRGEEIRPEKKVYILLNKPKDIITTTDDDRNRKTVMHLIRHATRDKRVYPVGRLDRMTTGLLLMTNDGELAQKLSHPSHGVKKVYAVTLDKPLEEEHIEQIRGGLKLEDGPAKVDAIEYVDPADGRKIGVEIHIGRNRIVRRLFEHMGYEVVKLDRVLYAGLTKKNLPRGKHRPLTEREIIRLKHLGGGK